VVGLVSLSWAECWCPLQENVVFLTQKAMTDILHYLMSSFVIII
jgi:hypothetical protein